jgi:hypothetical protein
MILGVASTLTACQKDNSSAEVSMEIRIDITKELGKVTRNLGGILTDPPRGPGLHMELGDPLGFNVHWLPEVKPSIIGMGWGGDAWYAYKPWVAEDEFDWDPLVTKIRSFREAGQEVRMNLCWVPEWLWDNEKFSDNDSIAGGPQQTIFKYLKKGTTRPPNDYDKWRKLVKETVYHLNEVENLGVHFDILNEPNINWFWNASLEDLITFYQVTAKAVKEASPDSLVGGPGFAMNSQSDFDWEWFEAWVQACAEDQTPVDFISWHSYLLPSIQLKRVMNFEEQGERVRGLLKKYPGLGEPKFYMTEWSYFWDLRLQPVDGFNGAYIANSLGEMLRAGYDTALYCGPLGPIEAPDSGAQALWIYNHLEENNLAVKLDGSEKSINAIATSGTDKVSVMVWDFPFSKEGEVPQKYRDEQAVEAIPGNTIRLCLDQLEAGDYKLVRRASGKQESDDMLNLKEETVLSSDGDLTLEFVIQPYSVEFIELTKI